MLISLFIIVLLSYIILWLWSRRHIYILHEHLKNETWSLPLLGNSLLFLGDDEVVADAEVADIVLKSCLNKDENMDIARELLGNGSIVAPVNIWRGRRKVLAPTFSMKNLTRFVSVFSQNSQTMANTLQAAAGGETFSIWRYLTSYTMDSVCETALGVKVQSQQSPSHPFLHAFERHCEMGAFRLLLPPLAQRGYKYLPVYDEYNKHIRCIHEFVDEVIVGKRITNFHQKRNEPFNNDNQEAPTTHISFLDLLTESSTYTDIELREETLVLILAGTDTSAVAAAFTCLMLAQHCDIQDRIYDELQEVFGDSREPVTAADLPRLKYLEAVIKETLRLYPPVPIITRKIDKDFVLPSGLTISKNTPMLINIWASHRNPRYWGEDAEVFRPERFLDSRPVHPAAFIPFSYGPRSCLGSQYAMMSIKTTLSTLLRQYKLLPAVSHDKHTPLRVKFDIMMKHVDNFQLKIELRK